jgi:hypothetical protein
MFRALDFTSDLHPELDFGLGIRSGPSPNLKRLVSLGKAQSELRQNCEINLHVTVPQP